MSPPSFLSFLLKAILFTGFTLQFQIPTSVFLNSRQDPSRSSQQPSADEKQRLLEQAQSLYQQQKFGALVPVLERALAIRETDLDLRIRELLVSPVCWE